MNTTLENTISEREAMLTGLRAFIRQRPGFEFGNYGDAVSYRRDVRQAFQALGNDVKNLRSTVDQLLAALGGKVARCTYSGAIFDASEGLRVTFGEQSHFIALDAIENALFCLIAAVACFGVGVLLGLAY